MQNSVHDQQNFEVRLFVHGDISFVAADLLPTKLRGGANSGIDRPWAASREEWHPLRAQNELVASTDSAIARLRDSVIRKVSMVVPSQPWQGAPAARAPLHPLRQTGLFESPSACPVACDAGRGNA